MTMFIFGAGYSGKAIAAARPEGVDVHGTTRSSEKFEPLKRAGIEPHLFDGVVSDTMAVALRDARWLVVSVAPDESGDPVLAAASNAIAAMPKLEWIGYLSTVGVYGDHAGGWVDETAACRPTSRRSTQRVVAEEAWASFGQETGVPVAILRLSGIYGPGRNALVNLEAGTARRIVKPDQVFNRIHGADIAGAVWHLAGQRLGGVFNVTDDLPAPPQDVVAYAAGLMGVEPPPDVPFDGAEMTPMARSFYGENKRVANAKLRAGGYRFLYPDYRAAFDAMWADGSWQGEGGADARSPIKPK